MRRHGIRGRIGRTPRRLRHRADAAARRGTTWSIAATTAIALVIALGPGIASALGLDADRTAAAAYSAPSRGMPLGADHLGRDVAARLLSGGAELIAVAAVSTCSAMLVGIALGLVLALGRRISRPLVIVIDVFAVLPSLITMMVLVYGIGSGLGTLVLIMTFVSAPFVARYTRALATRVSTSEYVLMARLSGDTAGRVARSEILPNLAGPLLAETGYRFVGSLYLVAAAGFLGLRPLDSGSDWATMVSEGLPGIGLNPWASLAPALAIAAITVPMNLLLDRATGRAR